MTRFNTILCPTDFSPTAGHAFQYACGLARDTNAKLVVVHCVEPMIPVMGEAAIVPDGRAEHMAEAKTKLDALQPTEPGIRIERVLREGPSAEAILEVAGEHKADLIVIGTHGRTGLKRLLMGSVAEAVLRRAECPVLTVKDPG
jgi:nucleotide-binding universal stress UspA family protein